MPRYTLRIVEDDRAATVTVADEQNPDAVLAEGVRGAFGIAADDIEAGRDGAVLEIKVEDANGRAVRHSIVSVSVAAIAIDPIDGDARPVTRQRPRPSAGGSRARSR